MPAVCKPLVQGFWVNEILCSLELIKTCFNFLSLEPNSISHVNSEYFWHCLNSPYGS